MPKTVNLINSVSENGTLVFVDTLVIKKRRVHVAVTYIHLYDTDITSMT